MKNASKAALISGLVFPGTGHLYLKRYLSGTIIIIAALFCIYNITSMLMHSAQQIMDQMQSSNGQTNMAELLELASTQTSRNSESLSTLSAPLFLFLWLLGIIDSYRIGNNQDKVDNTLANKN